LSPRITLALSIFKFDRMEWAIEKCTELGVARVVPLITARTETHLSSAASKRRERWVRLARQAAEQSRQVVAPEICQPIKLKDALTLPAGTRIVLSETERTGALKDVIRTRPGFDLALAIGPEGGWTESEEKAFAAEKWISATLGGNILRAETAAI